MTQFTEYAIIIGIAAILTCIGIVVIEEVEIKGKKRPWIGGLLIAIGIITIVIVMFSSLV